MKPQDIMDATASKVSSLGAAFYFVPETLAVGKEHGLDGMRFYVLGRGGVLGEVEPEVVTSGFGYFNNEVITKLWNSSKDKVAPRAAADLYNECCAAFGRARLREVEGLDGFVGAAQQLVAACPLGAMALYAGWAAQPLAEDMPGRAMQLLALLREQRGSAHLAAVLVTGLRPEIAHIMKRPEMAETFGWSADTTHDEADAALASQAEQLTNDALRPVYATLSEDQAAAFVAGVEAIEAALAA